MDEWINGLSSHVEVPNGDWPTESHKDIIIKETTKRQEYPKWKSGKQASRKAKENPNYNIVTQTNEEARKAPTSGRLVMLRKIDRMSSPGDGGHEYYRPAGRYDVAHVGPWQVVVPQNFRLRAGQPVLFYGHGAFIPCEDGRHGCSPSMFGKPRENYDGERGYVVQAKLFAVGQWQDGHIVSAVRFPEVGQKVAELRREYRGRDNSELEAAVRDFDFAPLLGVKRFEMDPDNLQNRVGYPPGFMLDMGVPNMDGLPSLFVKSKYHHIEYQESAKLDGHPMCCYFVRRDSKWFDLLQPLPARRDARMVFPHGRFGVCSPRCEWNNAYPTENMWWIAVGTDDIHTKMARHGASLVIVGDLVGHATGQNAWGIAKGHNELYVSTIYDLDTREYWSPYQVVEFAAKNGLRHVPVLGYTSIRAIASSPEELQARADVSGQQGLVYRSTCGDARSFKVMARDHGVPHAFWRTIPSSERVVVEVDDGDSGNGDASSASHAQNSSNTDLPKLKQPTDTHDLDRQTTQENNLVAEDGRKAKLMSKKDAESGIAVVDTRTKHNEYRDTSNKETQQLEAMQPLAMDNQVNHIVGVDEQAQTQFKNSAEPQNTTRDAKLMEEEHECSYVSGGSDQIIATQSSVNKRELLQKMLQGTEAAKDPKVDAIIEKYKVASQLEAESPFSSKDKSMDSHVQLAVWVFSKFFEICSTADTNNGNEETWIQFIKLNETTAQALQEMRKIQALQA